MKPEAQIHLFFDLDGTIWDLNHDTRIALQSIYNEIADHNEYADFSVFYENYMKINLELWELYKKNLISRKILEEKRFRDSLIKTGINDKKTHDYVSEKYIKKLMAHTTLFPEVKATLEELAGKYKLHIITNGFKEVQEEKLKHTGLLNIFEVITISEDTGYMKPDKRIFRHAMHMADAIPEYSFVIGDDYATDIKPAVELGMKGIYFNRLNNNITTTSTEVVTTWSEIKEYFKNIS